MRTVSNALATVKLYAVILWAAAWYGAQSEPKTTRRTP